MNHSMRLFSVTSLVLALAACHTIPPKAPETVLAEPNLPLAEAYDIIDNIETVSTPASEETPNLASIRWQDFYSDEKLKALIELGLEHNRSFIIKEIGVEQIAAKYQIENISNIPKLGASAGYGRSGVSNGGSSGSYSVGLGLSSYEIDFWGKLANKKEAALQDYLATNADKDTAQITLIASIAKAYATISYAKAQIILADSTVKTREQSLFIAKKRFEAGVDSKSPLLSAESSLATAHLSLIEAKTNLEKQLGALQTLIGTHVPEELLPEPALTSLVAPEVLNTGLPSDLLFYRPDIVAAEHKLKSAGADINVARAAYFPSVSLSLGKIGFGGKTLNDVFKDGVFGWEGVGIGLELPLFDAGARKAGYETSVLTHQSSLAGYEATIQTAFQEVRDILIERTAREERLALQYRLQNISQQSYNIAFATYRAGLSDYLGVLEAERGLFNAQQSILAIELEKLISQIELYRALGGGATLDAKQIAPSDTQEAAMTAARLASEDEVATLSKNPPKKSAKPTETPKKGKFLDKLKEKLKPKTEANLTEVVDDATPATTETASGSDGN